MIIAARRRRASALAIVLLAPGLLACDPQADQVPPQRVAISDGAEALPTIRSGIASIPSQLRPKPTPIEAYLESARESATLLYARQILAAKCMQDQGFRISVTPFSDLLAWRTQDVDFSRSRWFGLTDEGAARRYGYGEPPLVPEPTVDNSKVLRDPRAARAWDGDPALEVQLGDDSTANGCNRGAQMRLLDASGLDLTQPSLAERLRNDAASRGQATPEFASVYADFGACLKAAGYDVPDPQRPFASPAVRDLNKSRDRPAGKPAPTGEVKLALTDIRCKVEVDFVRRLERVVTLQQNRLIEANALALDEEKKHREKALERAATIIEAGDLP